MNIFDLFSKPSIKPEPKKPAPKSSSTREAAAEALKAMYHPQKGAPRCR